MNVTFAFKNLMNQKSGKLEEKWSYNSKSFLLSSPVVADIDGDGKKEIIFGTKDGKIYSIDVEGKIKWSYSVDENHNEVELMFLDAETSNSINATPHVEDINYDGQKEIIFGTESGKLYVLDHDGKMQWSFATEGPIRGSPYIQKFANNQSAIIFGSTDKHLYFLNSKGQLYWKFSCSSEVESCPIIIGGTQPLIVFGTNDGTIYAVNLQGQAVWTYKTRAKVLAQPSYDKLSSDSEPVIIIGSTDGNVYCLTTTGQTQWIFETEGAICSKVIIQDIDKDGKKEIVFGSCDNCVYAIDMLGKKLWSYETDFWVVASPIVTDLDGDGRLEIVAGSYDHNIYVLDAEGTYMLDYVPGVSGIITQTGNYGEAITKEPGKTKGKKIWQYKTDGIVVGCAYIDGNNNLIVNTDSGKVNNIIHKIE